MSYLRAAGRKTRMPAATPTAAGQKQFPGPYPFDSHDECVSRMSGEVGDPDAFCAAWRAQESGIEPGPDDPRELGFGPDGRRAPGRIELRNHGSSSAYKQAGGNVPSVKRLEVPMTVKIMDENGDGDVEFEGWASVFGVVDSDNEIVAHGAFTESLKGWAEAGRMPALLWQHDHREVIGRYDLMRETEEGLYVKGRLFTRDIPRARQAARLLRERALDGLSIGFIIRPPVTMDEHTGVRTLYRLDLLEVSLVTWPANDLARVTAAKEAAVGGVRIAANDVPEFGTLKEASRWLRSVGFSKQAAEGVTCGIRRVLNEEPPGEPESGGESEGGAKAVADDQVAQEALASVKRLTDLLTTQKRGGNHG